ncbi:MAG: DUF4230 domain-containing protein [Chloroflexota bacterium]
MDDEQNASGNRHRHFDGQDARDTSENSGPDTVRILPDSGHPHDDSDEWYVERPVVRSGTLYTRVPVDPTQTLGEQDRTTQSAPPAQSKQIEPVGDRILQGQSQPPAQTSQPRKRPSGCAIVGFTVSLLLVSCALLSFVTLRNGLDGLGKLGGLIPSFGLVTTPTVTIDTSRPTVIDQIRALARLETVHYQLEKVISGKASGPLPDFLTSDKILLVAHGEVIAGVDLAELGPGDITVVSDTVTIRMPKALILSSKLDNDKTYVYDRQTGIFNKPDVNLETQIRQVAEQQIVQTAMEDDILGKAQKNAEDVIRTLVNGLGYSNVRFVEGP